MVLHKLFCTLVKSARQLTAEDRKVSLTLVLLASLLRVGSEPQRLALKAYLCVLEVSASRSGFSRGGNLTLSHHDGDIQVQIKVR